MQQIGKILEKNKKTKASKPISERHSIVGEIDARLKASSFKPISLPFLGRLLARFKTCDLYGLHKECSNANNYAALFWTLVKRKPNSSSK